MTTTNHTIGEDAANVAIGEREAALMCERLRSMGLNTCNEAAALIECLARAALTAEKVAGPVAVYPQGVMGIPPYSPPGSGSVTVDPGISRNAAPQHPAQPVAQTLALTDEQILLIYRAIPGKDVIGNATTVDEMHDRILLAFARALLAAQPASSLAEGDKQ